jgi:hypothetical protein
LRDQSRWTPEAIVGAMHAGTETHVKLREAIPIHILYFTSWVDPKGGLQFRDDVYGYDAKQTAVTTVTRARRREGAKADKGSRPEARTPASRGWRPVLQRLSPRRPEAKGLLENN